MAAEDSTEECQEELDGVPGEDGASDLSEGRTQVSSG